MNNFTQACAMARGFLLNATAENFQGIVDLLLSIKDWKGDDPMYTHDVEALERYIQTHLDDNPAWSNARFFATTEGFVYESPSAYIRELQDQYRAGIDGNITYYFLPELLHIRSHQMPFQDGEDSLYYDLYAGEELPDEFWTLRDELTEVAWQWIIEHVWTIQVFEIFGIQGYVDLEGGGGYVIAAKIFDERFGSMIRGD